MVPCILEAIISGFLDADALKLCVGKRLQAPVNLDAQILGGRYFIEKHRDIFIERFVIEFLENLTFDESVQVGEIRDHAGGWVYAPRHADFDYIVMTVAMGIVAFAKNSPILFFA